MNTRQETEEAVEVRLSKDEQMQQRGLTSAWAPR
jgi:flagellar M-ring protein FliF